MIPLSCCMGEGQGRASPPLRSRSVPLFLSHLLQLQKSQPHEERMLYLPFLPQPHLQRRKGYSVMHRTSPGNRYLPSPQQELPQKNKNVQCTMGQNPSTEESSPSLQHAGRDQGWCPAVFPTSLRQQRPRRSYCLKCLGVQVLLAVMRAAPGSKLQIVAKSNHTPSSKGWILESSSPQPALLSTKSVPRFCGDQAGGPVVNFPA